jgi:hypothetical protein
MIFKIFSLKKLAKILAFFAQTAARFCKNLKTPIFCSKWAKIAENIDPR